MSIRNLNTTNFDGSIANGTTLVDFYADWCSHCRTVAVVLDKITEERRDVAVCKVNVDSEKELATKYGVMSLPTLIVFKDGKEKTRLVGSQNKAAILAEL